MPIYPSWEDVFWRLAWTVAAGAAIGYTRGERGHAAGFRTCLLVCLAASVAMIQANMLLPISGKTNASFAVMDLMRLPLGILTGVGFIGAGAILRKGSIVIGVTTAATLWLVTVIGLCLGGGQVTLGLIATVLALFVLWVLRWFDLRISRVHRASVVLKSVETSAAGDEFVRMVKSQGYTATLVKKECLDGPKGIRLSFEVEWHKPDASFFPTGLIEFIESRFDLESFELSEEPRN